MSIKLPKRNVIELKKKMNELLKYANKKLYRNFDRMEEWIYNSKIFSIEFYCARCPIA